MHAAARIGPPTTLHAACPITYPEITTIKEIHKAGGRAENDIESYCRKRDDEKHHGEEKRMREA